MKVRDIMTKEIRACCGRDPIRHVADIMAERDLEIVPVREGADFVGVVTDRDITVRAVARGIEPDMTVNRIMTPRVCFCSEPNRKLC